MTSVDRRSVLWPDTLTPRQLHQVLTHAERLGRCQLYLLDRTGRVLARGEAAGAVSNEGGDDDTAGRRKLAITVNDEAVAWLVVINAGDASPLIEQAITLSTQWITTAYINALEIDSLAGEIVHLYEEQHLLYELGESLTSELRVVDAVNLVLDRLVATIEAHHASIKLDGPPPVTIAWPDAATSTTATTGHSVLQGISTALRCHGQTVGELNLYRLADGEPFSSVDGKLLDAIGSLVGNALRNIQLYERLEQQATALQASETFLRSMLDHIAEGIITVNDLQQIEYLNPAAERIFGYIASDVIGQSITLLLPESLTAAMSGRPWMADGKPGGQHPAIGQRHDGTTFPAEMTVSAMTIYNRPLQIITVRDVTERSQREAALQYHALHDALTNLPNRTLLNERLHQALVSGQREVALLLMDLDNFKEVNDSFGHHCGDLLLQQVSQRLQVVLRESDTIARLGGDEFAILLPGAGTVGATLAALRILKLMEHPVVIDSHNLNVQISIGIALCPEHATDAATLLRRADIAMYVAKRSRSGYTVYATYQEDQASPNRLTLLGDLRAALNEGQLSLCYQPKIDIRTGRIVHVEALARWHHPSHGLIPPEVFIPLAERSGLIIPLSYWVFETAIVQCRRWHDQGFRFGISVNLSAQNLHDPGLVETLAMLLNRYQLADEWLKIELTESSLIIDPDRALETLQRLSNRGIRIAVDDFGTGYSSLSYLKQLPIDEIKIDKSFVLKMTTNENDAAIVRATIALGHDLGLRVVAEGVENRDALDLLAQLHCDTAQGYFLSPPLAVDDFEEWLGQTHLSGQ